MKAKFVNEAIKHLTPHSKSDLAKKGIKVTYTKNIEFNIGRSFNQFSFSRYDDESYDNYRDSPVFQDDDGVVLVTGFKWISDIPIYSKQLNLIIDAIEKDFKELGIIDFPLKELSISYNNYGSLFLLWKIKEYDEDIFDRIIEFNENDEWSQGNLEELAMKFNDINSDYGPEIENARDLEAYLRTEKELGYTLSDVSDIQDICDLDEKTIIRVRNKVEKSK